MPDPLPTRTQTLSFDGHTVRVERHDAETADAAPLVLIHGAFVSPSFMRFAVPADLLRQRTWCNLPLPGHHPWTLPEDLDEEAADTAWLTRTLVSALEALGQERPPVLVGHSLGGLAALALAADRPDAYAGVLAVSAFGGGVFDEGGGALLQLMSNLGPAGRLGFWSSVKASVFNETVHRRLSEGAAADKTALRDSASFKHAVSAYLPDVRASSAEGLRRFLKHVPDFDIREALRGVTCPVHLIAGDADPVVPAAHTELLHRLMPGSRLSWIPNAGHLPMFERPDVYDAAVRRAVI